MSTKFSALCTRQHQVDTRSAREHPDPRHVIALIDQTQSRRAAHLCRVHLQSEGVHPHRRRSRSSQCQCGHEDAQQRQAPSHVSSPICSRSQKVARSVPDKGKKSTLPQLRCRSESWSAHRSQAAVQVCVPDSRRLLRYRCAGDRLLRSVSPVLRRCAGRVQPPSGVARSRACRRRVRHARVERRLRGAGALRRSAGGLREDEAHRAVEHDERIRRLPRGRRRSDVHGRTDGGAGGPPERRPTPIPETYKRVVADFEGADLELAVPQG